MRIMRSLNRRVSWLMAAKSFKTPIIGSLAMGIGVVPVSRAMDSTKAGEGTIYLPDPNGNPKLLCGIGTTFDGPEFEVGGSIYLPTVNGDSQKLDIAEIRGPNEISLKNAPSHIDALQQLSQPQGTKFKVAPHVDQADVYKAVFDRLRDEGCIGIFPEGGSHDRSDMLPLKGKYPWGM
jgi:glycerol-3-phosphate O-acyltransferase/dihydroxyacetone phosphate acyltransferase